MPSVSASSGGRSPLPRSKERDRRSLASKLSGGRIADGRYGRPVSQFHFFADGSCIIGLLGDVFVTPGDAIDGACDSPWNLRRGGVQFSP